MAIAMVRETKDLRIGACGSLLVNVWFTQATVDTLKQLGEEQERLLRQYEKITVLSVAMNIPKAPDADAAAYLKDTQKLDGLRSRGTIIAILPRGLGAVIARSFIAAVSLFSKDQYIVVKSLDEAAAAVRKLPGQDKELVQMDALSIDLSAFVELPRVT